MSRIWQNGRCKGVYGAYSLIWLVGWSFFVYRIGGIDCFFSLLSRDMLQLSLFVFSLFIPIVFCLSWFDDSDVLSNVNASQDDSESTRNAR